VFINNLFAQNEQRKCKNGNCICEAQSGTQRCSNDCQSSLYLILRQLVTSSQLVMHVQGVMRDKGIILLFTSATQLLTSERQSSLSATGKRNRLAQFRVHKIASGIRMFESVLFPQQFIRVGDGACDIMVRQCQILSQLLILCVESE